MVQTMLRKVLLSSRSNLTASISLPALRRRSDIGLSFPVRLFYSEGEVSSDAPPQPGVSDFPREDSVIDGCDYKHWLVIMHQPDNYPQRDEIIQQYITTLAVALGSEKAARESMYSVSTKYYYAFSCKVAENVTHKIKSLPRVKWVLPDSYLCTEESGYGGEPFIDGKIVPYEEKYHANWLRGTCDNSSGRTHSRRPRRRRRGSRISGETNDLKCEPNSSLKNIETR